MTILVRLLRLQRWEHPRLLARGRADATFARILHSGIAQGPITESPSAAVLDVPLDDRLGPESEAGPHVLWIQREGDDGETWPVPHVVRASHREPHLPVPSISDFCMKFACYGFATAVSWKAGQRNQHRDLERRPHPGPASRSLQQDNES